ncbi:hypothetical protein M0802_004473 [Mischocyttarus mexicanus]|nr:hypothetical protein M0802_004473 [Mischocyttarus mexicanus]
MTQFNKTEALGLKKEEEDEEELFFIENKIPLFDFETKTEVHIGNKSPLGESMILTVVMVCSMASILMVLIPTALYQ